MSITMPRFLRLRYLLLYALIYLAYSNIEVRWVLERPVTRAITTQLSKAGFPDTTFTVSELTFGHLSLDHIKLDPDGVNTIDNITVTYSPWSLLWGRVDDIIITKPDFIFSADSPPPLPQTSGPSSTPFRLSTLPFQNLSVTDLSLAYAGDDISPSVTGKVGMTTNDNGQKQLSFDMTGAQKDLSLKLTGSVTEDSNQTLHVILDIPEARFDIPNILMMSRAHGKFDITIPTNAPISANGEWAAGAMRIGNFPLDNISLVVQGRKPDFSLIGNADITGLPQSNLSLRLSEDQNGAQLIAQISGTSPQGFLKLAAPTITAPMPEHQKFVITLDLKDNDLAALFTAPYSGGLFLYGDDATPFLSMSVGCNTSITDCTLNIPETTLTASQINPFIEPLLADYGLMFNNGAVTFSGAITPLASPTPQYAFQAKSKNMSIDWQGLSLSRLAFDVTRDINGTYQIKPGSANVMNGSINVNAIKISSAGDGRTTMRLNKIDLADLSQFIRIEGLDVTGTATGNIPVTLNAWKPAFDRGGKIDGFKGSIKYTPPSYPGFLGGTDDRMKVLRNTLQDYTFDSMNLNFSGDPFGTVSATLAAKGRNESLFKDRPIHINLNIDGPLTPAIKQLIPYFGSTDHTQDALTDNNQDE